MKAVTKWLLFGLMAGSISAGSAWAEPGEGGGKEKRSPEERFAKLDADGDGTVTLAEFTTAHEKRMEKMKEHKGERPEGAKPPPSPDKIFGRMDADGDGSVTLEEFKAHGENRKAGMKEKKKEKKSKVE